MNTRELFHVRPYQEADLADCTTCLYESFFTCSISKEDRLFLQEYIQVLLEKCNFTLVAENDSKKVAGFICGKQRKHTLAFRTVNSLSEKKAPGFAEGMTALRCLSGGGHLSTTTFCF